jgi:hypothetical protein
MTNDRTVKKLYEWKLISVKLAGRPEIRWENIREDLQIMKITRQNASTIRLKGSK